MSQFRMSSHMRAIETGRYSQTERYNRICFHCLNVVEDEFNFILKCPLYTNLRKNTIKFTTGRNYHLLS